MPLKWALLGQAALILAVLVLPFGFDHPSSLGLDFGHLLLIAAAYGVLLIFGLIAAAKRRNWAAFMAQVVTPCVVVGLSYVGVLRI